MNVGKSGTLLNSLIPVTNARNVAANTSSNTGSGSGGLMGIMIFFTLIGISIAVAVFFPEETKYAWDSFLSGSGLSNFFSSNTPTPHLLIAKQAGASLSGAGASMYGPSLAEMQDNEYEKKYNAMIEENARLTERINQAAIDAAEAEEARRQQVIPEQMGPIHSTDPQFIPIQSDTSQDYITVVSPATENAPRSGETNPENPPNPTGQASSILDKMLPGMESASTGDSSTAVKKDPSTGKEVFSVSSNKYTYYDAEPLCKALGAELATYKQVKESWKKGADWCNYGWVKGQMAVYPTQMDSYLKLQTGPAENRLSCGRPGINGGYYDNPELRFGVNCFGTKPSQSKHDEVKAVQGAPLNPDAIEFDKKVARFKADSDHIGILPFNQNSWSD